MHKGCTPATNRVGSYEPPGSIRDVLPCDSRPDRDEDLFLGATYSRRLSAPGSTGQASRHRGASNAAVETRIRNTGRRGTTNGDGTWDEFTTLQGTFTRPGLRTPPKRWLVVCLDGVAVGEMQSMWDRGHFREFFRPIATVSTFPSGTETAMTDVLHAVPVPGYEHIYFDRGANRTRGGFSIALTGLGIPYIRALDYDTPGWAKIVHFVGRAKRIAPI